MERRGLIKVAAVVSLLCIAGTLGLSACSSGVPQKDVDALKQQLADKDKDLATAKQQAALAPWIAKPNAPPRPAPPPPAPGTTPPPAPKPPAAKTVPLAFYVDTVTAGPGESKFNVDASVGCARTGLFKRGMHIVWRMEVVDTANGKVLQDIDVDSAVVKVPQGPEVKLRYGRHGATDNSPWFWTAAWDVPLDYPLGTVDYSINVTTKAGKTGTFKEMRLLSVAPPLNNAGLTIVE
ncbi:MAG: hypothetical protein Q7R57_02660 [Dehalococcoidales bacterium]|nr:hypothetical protein [Dehalococcoidales bacterium]